MIVSQNQERTYVYQGRAHTHLVYGGNTISPTETGPLLQITLQSRRGTERVRQSEQQSSHCPAIAEVTILSILSRYQEIA